MAATAGLHAVSAAWVESRKEEQTAFSVWPVALSEKWVEMNHL